MPVYKYATSTWRGVPRYGCVDCPFDVLKNLDSMMDHCKRFNHGLDQFGGVTNEEWLASQADGPKNKLMVMGQICWNTRQASTEAAIALTQEVQRLESLGNSGYTLIVDNGSQDGTARSIIGSMPDSALYDIICNNYNLGISKARNQIIDEFLKGKQQWDYLLFTDGDIEVVPYSSYVMMKYLECHFELGCIGAYSSNYASIRERADTRFLEIQESRVRDDIKVAWTQYGLFRGEMFRQGIRFDESGPFGEPGWGFEDDDLAFQMMEKGWGNKYFGGMCYLHRNIRSSWPNMEAEGLDPVAIFYKRKDYLLKKWKGRIPEPILKTVAAQHPPRRPDGTK